MLLPQVSYSVGEIVEYLEEKVAQIQTKAQATNGVYVIELFT